MTARLRGRPPRNGRDAEAAARVAYREFLLRNLGRGSTIYLVECTRSCPITRATEHEYLRGRPRVRDHLHHYGSARPRWDPPEPNNTAPESAWGFDAALSTDIVVMGARMNWRVVEIRFREPESLSFVAAAIYLDWHGEAGVVPTRALLRAHGPSFGVQCLERTANPCGPA